MGANKRIGLSKYERDLAKRYCNRFGLLDYNVEISRASGKRRLYLLGTDSNGLTYRIRFFKVKRMKSPKICQIVNKKECLIYQSKKVHGDRYDFSLVNEGKIGTKDYLNIICEKHGIFRKTKSSLITNREGCPKCAKNRLNNNRRYFKK